MMEITTIIKDRGTYRAVHSLATVTVDVEVRHRSVCCLHAPSNGLLFRDR